MPSTRARHDGFHKPATPHPSRKFSSFAQRASRPLFRALLSLGLIPTLAAAAHADAAGVKGWITGSQTYIRVHPDVTTPPVAKVPAHTPVHIWGKKNGWYRVETTDKKLGWVYFDYVKASDPSKVDELSDRKARLASQRSSKQKMYGSPELLKKYYSKYPSKGAAKGLAMHGIYVQKPQVAKAASKKPATVAKAPVSAQARPVVLKTSPASRVQVAGAVKVVSPVPVQESVAETPAVKSTPSFPSAVAGKPVVSTQSKPVAILIPPSVDPPAAKVQPAVPQQPKVATVPAHSAPRSKKDLQREQLRKRLATGSRGGKTSPIAVPPVSPEELMKAREQFLNKRNERMGSPADASTPASGATVLAPAPPANLQPSSLNKDFSANRPLGGPVVVAHSLLRPRPEDCTSPRQEAEVRPGEDAAAAGPDAVATRTTPAEPKAPILLAKNPAPAPKASTKTAAKTASASRPSAKPAAAPASRGAVAYRGGSPRDRYNMRGGSPRDRYAGNFGKSVAQQALAYRGMPYRRGAASPSRGFDCSGLVYYCLRQRGLNPPRTAAGYAKYGKAVPAGQLKEGDLVLFANTYKRGISHIGVYIGSGKFVHAATSGTGVRVDYLNSDYYRRKYYGARRVQ